MRKVIRREVVLNEYDQVTDIIDHPSTYEEAEKIQGEKLDRRKNYGIVKGVVAALHFYTGACSGCSDDGEYSCSSRGCGCSECGYHGAVRSGMYIPLNGFNQGDSK